MTVGWLYAGAFFVSLLLGLAFTPIVRGLAIRKNIVAHPRNDRWHCRPTAMLGGVAIFAAFTCSSFLFFFASPAFRTASSDVLPLYLAGAAVFFLGLADDLFEINAQFKLVGQMVVASAMVFWGYHIDWFASMTANSLVSLLWIVGITNAFNLLDNMDGLSAGIAVISAGFLFLWIFSGAVGIVVPLGFFLITLIYMGSILGFLAYNFYPASIFMGDAGSMFIGFMLSAMTMTAGASGISTGSGSDFFYVVLIPILILFVPILDTALVSLTRRMSNRPIFQGGRDHSSHRMVAIGFSEKKTVIFLYVFAAASGLLSLIIIPAGIYLSLAIIFFYLFVVALFWIYLASMDVYKGDSRTGEKEKRCPKIRPEISPNLMTLLVMGFDLVLVTMAYYVAYLLRFEWDMGANFDFFLKSLPVLYACQISGFYASGFYKRTWWGLRLVDFAEYLKGVTAGTVAAMLVLLFLYRFQSFSRAVFVIYWGVMLILIIFSRSFLRIVDEVISRKNAKGKPVLVWGAGRGGQLLAREIENNPELDMRLEGFMDDDLRLAGKRIHGYTVFGGMEQLQAICEIHQIREIVISFRDNDNKKKQQIIRTCKELNIDVEVRRLELALV